MGLQEPGDAERDFGAVEIKQVDDTDKGKEFKTMLKAINPKLPMRDKAATKDFYINKLGFHAVGSTDFEGYLMVEKDDIELHFFEFKDLDPTKNYGQVYIRTDNIDGLYKSYVAMGLIHPHGPLEAKPWGQREFSLLDPDTNLLTFGQPI